jgi:hypothetical protein
MLQPWLAKRLSGIVFAGCSELSLNHLDSGLDSGCKRITLIFSASTSLSHVRLQGEASARESVRKAGAWQLRIGKN